MSKWANNDAIAIAENLAKVAYRYYVFDEESEALEYYDAIACGTSAESTGCIYRDVLYEIGEIEYFAKEYVKIDQLRPEDTHLLVEALNIASAYDGPLAQADLAER